MLLFFHVQIAKSSVTYEIRDGARIYEVRQYTKTTWKSEKRSRMRLGAALSFIEVPTDVLHKDVFWGNEGEYLNVSWTWSGLRLIGLCDSEKRLNLGNKQGALGWGEKKKKEKKRKKRNVSVRRFGAEMMVICGYGHLHNCILRLFPNKIHREKLL